jgi:hypothetical protein
MLAQAPTCEEPHRRHEHFDGLCALWQIGREPHAHVVITSAVTDEVPHIEERFGGHLAQCRSARSASAVVEEICSAGATSLRAFAGNSTPAACSSFRTLAH